MPQCVPHLHKKINQTKSTKRFGNIFCNLKPFKKYDLLFGSHAEFLQRVTFSLATMCFSLPFDVFIVFIQRLAKRDSRTFFAPVSLPRRNCHTSY